jgi:hypothetical protein
MYCWSTTCCRRWAFGRGCCVWRAAGPESRLRAGEDVGVSGGRLPSARPRRRRGREQRRGGRGPRGAEGARGSAAGAGADGAAGRRRRRCPRYVGSECREISGPSCQKNVAGGKRTAAPIAPRPTPITTRYARSAVKRGLARSLREQASEFVSLNAWHSHLSLLASSLGTRHTARRRRAANTTACRCS